MKKIIALAAVSLLLAACGKTLDGTYVNEQTGIEMTFEGKKLDYMGMAILDYVVEDGFVKVENGGASMQFKIKDENTIIFPMMGEFKKQ